MEWIPPSLWVYSWTALPSLLCSWCGRVTWLVLDSGVWAKAMSLSAQDHLKHEGAMLFLLSLAWCSQLSRATFANHVLKIEPLGRRGLGSQIANGKDATCGSEITCLDFPWERNQCALGLSHYSCGGLLSWFILAQLRRPFSWDKHSVADRVATHSLSQHTHTHTHTYALYIYAFTHIFTRVYLFMSADQDDFSHWEIFSFPGKRRPYSHSAGVVGGGVCVVCHSVLPSTARTHSVPVGATKPGSGGPAVWGQWGPEPPWVGTIWWVPLPWVCPWDVLHTVLNLQFKAEKHPPGQTARRTGRSLSGGMKMERPLQSSTFWKSSSPVHDGRGDWSAWHPWAFGAGLEGHFPIACFSPHSQSCCSAGAQWSLLAYNRILPLGFCSVWKWGLNIKALIAKARKTVNPESGTQGDGKKLIFIGEIWAAWETRMEKSTEKKVMSSIFIYWCTSWSLKRNMQIFFMPGSQKLLTQRKRQRGKDFAAFSLSQIWWEN